MFLRFMFRGCGGTKYKVAVVPVLCRRLQKVNTYMGIRWIVGAAYPNRTVFNKTLHSCYICRHNSGKAATWWCGTRELYLMYIKKNVMIHTQAPGMESVKCYLSVYDTQRAQRVRKFRIIASEIGERRISRCICL